MKRFITSLLVIFILFVGLSVVYAQEETNTVATNTTTVVTNDTNQTQPATVQETNAATNEEVQTNAVAGESETTKEGVYSDGKNEYVKKGYKLDINAEDKESGVNSIQVSLNGRSLGGYKDPIPLLKEGKNVIVWKAIDNVGNEEIFVRKLIVDGKGPKVYEVIGNPVVIKGAEIYISKDTPIELKAIDDYSGVKGISYKVNDGEWADYLEAVKIDNSGLNALYYKAVDNVGNESEEKVVWVVVDTTAPDINVRANVYTSPDGEKYAAPNTQFEVLTKDLESGVAKVTISVDGGDEVEYTGPFTLKPGKHTIVVKAVDAVGNESSLEYTVTIDAEGPTSNSEIIEK